MVECDDIKCVKEAVDSFLEPRIIPRKGASDEQVIRSFDSAYKSNLRQFELYLETEFGDMLEEGCYEMVKEDRDKFCREN